MMKETNRDSAKAPPAGAAKRGRPVSEGLADQIIDTASMLFVMNGFHATTMEKVAQAASVSKLSIYRHFENKDALFAACITRKCREFAPDSLFTGAADSLEERLLGIGEGLFRLMMSDEARAIEGMVTADPNGRHLAELYFTAGPLYFCGKTEALLQRLDAEGSLAIPDPVESAKLFVALFKGANIMTRAQYAPEAAQDDAGIRAYCLSAVRMFIKGHARD